MLIDLSLSGLTWIRCGSLNFSLRLDLRIVAIISKRITRFAQDRFRLPWPALEYLRLHPAHLLLDLDLSLDIGVTHSFTFVTVELSRMLVNIGTYRKLDVYPRRAKGAASMPSSSPSSM